MSQSLKLKQKKAGLWAIRRRYRLTKKYKRFGNLRVSELARTSRHRVTPYRRSKSSKFCTTAICSNATIERFCEVFSLSGYLGHQTNCHCSPQENNDNFN